MMNLDEAIKHCEEVAEAEEQKYKEWKGDYSHLKKIDSCLECAKEHRQLAEWLKALKEIWDSGDCNDCRNGQCEWKPKLGHLVRYNCPHYVGIANGEVNIDKPYKVESEGEI